MSKSLQDQLLALGLAKGRAKDNAQDYVRNKARDRIKDGASKPQKPASTGAGKAATGAAQAQAQDRQRSGNPAKPIRSPQTAEQISLEDAYRIRAQFEKAEKQKAQERTLEEERRRAALNQEIRQIVEAGRLNEPEALESRYFMFKQRIRKVYVTPEQLVDVNEGRLGVVYLSGGYHLLTMDQVEAIRKLSPAHVPELLVGEADDEERWDAASTKEGETAGD